MSTAPVPAVEAAIRLDALSKDYRDVRAVDHVSFTVAPGQIFGFMGHNGAGKTTTIKMLLGLTPPSAGSASVLGHDVVRDSLEVRRLSGYLPGSFALPKDMTAAAFLAYVAAMFGMKKGPARARVEELLALFGLASVANKELRGFSSGMTQKVGLAQALINDPRVLFLDEPTSGLDPIGRHEFLQHIRHLARDKGVTVMFSTHILGDIESICESVAVMHRGKLVASGSLDGLKARYGKSRMDDLYLAIAEQSEALS